jgi:hypothetical protein
VRSFVRVQMCPFRRAARPRTGSLEERLEKGPGSAAIVQTDIFEQDSLLEAASEISRGSTASTV